MYNLPDGFIWNNHLSSGFPDPFCDMASHVMPRDITSSHRFCEYICSANGPYRAALERVVSYFLTDIEIVALQNKDEHTYLGDAEKKQYTQFFNETLKIKTLLKAVALDFLVYGNSMTSLILPFRRYLTCKTPNCNHEVPVNEFFNDGNIRGRFETFEFHGRCPVCKKSGKWTRRDRKWMDPAQVRVKRWSVHELEIFNCPYSNKNRYEWVIPPKIIAACKRGHVHHLQNIPWEVIDAVKKGNRLMFGEDVLYHMAEPPLAGVDTAGWGLSRVLVNFRQAYLTQILNRQNEAIAMDYITPLRTITPAAKAGSTPETSDPLATIGMGDFMGHVRKMLRIRRQDPTAIHTMPYPIDYNVHGGEGKQLAPTDLVSQALQQLLDSIGVPVELYKGTLTVQAAPAALRLFEATWSQLVDALNDFLHDLAQKLAKIFDWAEFSCRLRRVTHADDLNRQMAQLQLAQAGKISDSTGLASVGLNFAEEMQKKMDDQKLMAKLEERTQQELQQQDALKQLDQPQDPAAAAQGVPAGAAPPGAMPPGAPPPQGGAPAPGGMAMQVAQQMPAAANAPTSLDEIQAQADSLAQQLLGLPSDSQRTSALLELKKRNPVLHAATKSMYDSYRRQAALQGRDMVLQQQFSGQPQ